VADQIAIRPELPVVDACSSTRATVAFRTRSTSAASVPSSIRYRVDCLTNERNVINWTSVSAASSATITVPGTYNGIINDANDVEVRQLMVEIDTGLSTQVRNAVTWRVKNNRIFEPMVSFDDALQLEAFYPADDLESALSIAHYQYPPGHRFRYLSSFDVLDAHYYRITAAEISAGVTPTNYQYPPGYQERYSTLADIFACGEKTLYLAQNTTTTITSALSVPSNTRIVGHGSNSVIKAGANISLLTIDGKSNVILENFKLDGTRATYTTSSNNGVNSPANGTGSTNITVKGLEIVDVAGVGILFLAQTGSHSSRIKIHGNYVYNTGAHGIICQDFVDETDIQGNHVENFGMVVSDRPGITTGRSAVRHRVLGNYVKCSSSAVGSSVHGISMDNCNDFVCNDNVVENTIGYGIELGGAQEGTCNGNHITDCTRACIGVGSSTLDNRELTISGNVCSNSDDAGIYLHKGAGTNSRNISITGNTINTMGTMGLYLADACLYVAVTGNVIHDCVQSGIFVNVSNYVTISGNVLRSNNSSANASHAGVRVVNAAGETNIVIGPNQVTGSGVANYTVDNPIINDGTPHKPLSGTFTAADATPSVGLGGPGRIFKTADTTTYTAFDDTLGESDQFYLLALHAAVVTNNAAIKTSTGANKTLTVNVIYSFINVGGVWYEVATA
jgi:hypothetical protein